MTIHPRLLGRLFPGGLLTLACLVGSGTVLGQSQTPINPLRQPPGITQKIVTPPPESSEKKAMVPPAEPVVGREVEAVRQAAYTAPSRVRYASRQAVPNEATYGTSVLTQSEPGPAITRQAVPEPVVTPTPDGRRGHLRRHVRGNAGRPEHGHRGFGRMLRRNGLRSAV